MSIATMPLNFLDVGKYGQVNDLAGSEILCKKLMEMGLNRGSVIQIMRNDAGPLIIKVGDSRLVLGRGMAQKVMVKEI